VADPRAARRRATPVQKQLTDLVQADDSIGFDAFGLRVEQVHTLPHVRIRRPDEADSLRLQPPEGPITTQMSPAGTVSDRSSIAGFGLRP
jgi:hypothetical protein